MTNCIEDITTTKGKQEIFLDFLNSLIPRNIMQIYSSVLKPTKLKVIEKYMPGC
jgi:hypothetical protein